MFDHHRDGLSFGQRQRSGSVEGEVAVRTLDPEPINFLTPRVLVERQDRSFSPRAVKVKT